MCHLKDLQQSAKSVAQSVTWALQEFYPADPVFSGLVVQADIMYTGFIAADVCFRTLLTNIQCDRSASLGAFSWGTPVDKFREWVASVAQQPRPAFRRGPHDTANSDTSARRDTSSASQGSDFDMDKDLVVEWWYGVAVGVKEGVYREWATVKV